MHAVTDDDVLRHQADIDFAVALVNEWPAIRAMRDAARDLYILAVQEHGHDETHSADWPSCLPAHIAMNRYRAALHHEAGA